MGSSETSVGRGRGRLVAAVGLVLVCLAGGLVARPAAEAASPGSRFTLKRITTNLTATLGAPAPATVTLRGPLAVPSDWTLVGRSATRVRLRDAEYPSCVFDVRLQGRAARSAPQSAAAYVASLSTVTDRYVLDDGTRGDAAWRVVRLPGGSSRGIRVVGDLATPIRTPSVQVSGQATWAVVHVVATAPADAECHSGMYRQALGPQIGDALATWRSLVFANPA